MRFDNVLANLGGGYNVNTGSFTAPVQGLYFFMVYCMRNSNGGQSILAIYANNNRICTAKAYSVFAVATCSAFIQLEVGEVVNVRAASNAKLHQNNENNKNQHALVGFLYST